MKPKNLVQGPATTKRVKCACGAIEVWPKERTGAGTCSKCGGIIRG